MNPDGLRTDRPEVSLQGHASDAGRVYQAGRDMYVNEGQPSAPAAVSNTLPRDTYAFEGRGRELRTLVDDVRRKTAAGEPLPIYMIDGMPGAGKTLFAVHAAHLLADRFPDGTLFVDLHAHTAGQRPVEPVDALGSLLAINGVATPNIPAGPDTRSALWRGRLAGRRVLLVLDNAAHYLQVKPLLPNSESCLVLVTSRRRLSTLDATVPLSLGALQPDEAMTLLSTLSGRDLAGSEDAAAALVRLCGHLPLAISLAAGKLSQHASWLVEDLVEDLSDAQTRLDELQADDVAVAATFELSYRALSDDQKAFFRRLGLHPGPDIDICAAAALAGVPEKKARHHLGALHNDHLIEEPASRRYRMHDLIRDYTRALAEQDGQAANAEATGHLFAYYQSTAARADRHLDTGLRPAIPPDPGGSDTPALQTRADALNWLETERANLLACAEHTIRQGQHPQLLRFAETMAGFLRQAGPWDRAIEIHRAATAAASRDADPLDQARSLVHLAIVQYLSGDYPHAREALEGALDLFHDTDDMAGQAVALCHLGIVHERTNTYDESTTALERSLDLYQRLDDRKGQADAILHLGIVAYLKAEYPGAIVFLGRSLALFRDDGNVAGQAEASYHLGLVWWLIDDYPKATEALEKASAMRLDLGDRLGAAEVQNWLGAVWCASGEHEAALRVQQDALSVFREMGSALNESEALYNLGISSLYAQEYERAADFLTRSLAIASRLGNPLGEADSLWALGSVHRRSGDHEKSAESLESSLALYRELENELGEAAGLNEMGALLFATGHPAEALERHERALRLARSLQSPYEEALALAGIGRYAHHEQEFAVGLTHLRNALAILRRIGSVEAPAVAEELTALERAVQAGSVDEG